MLTVLFLRYFDVVARPALEDSTTAGVQAVLLAATVRSPFWRTDSRLKQYLQIVTCVCQGGIGSDGSVRETGC